MLPEQYTMSRVVLGLEKFLRDGLKVYSKAKIAVLTNASAIDSHGRKSIDLLIESGFKIVKIFAPEHGLEGALADGMPVPDHNYHGIPVYSLFGTRARPSSDLLTDIDILLYDIQDVGVRFYTYIYTLIYCMEECANAKKKVIILDRPNPLSSRIEGPRVKKNFESFVGGYGLPVRYGLTAGELARYVKEVFKVEVDLEIVPMERYNPKMYFDETGLFWSTPSPNLPSLEHAILYSGLCLLEGVNVSVGRGTVHPFKYIGAPWINSDVLYAELKRLNHPGITFRKIAFIPWAFKFKNELCHGLEFFITNRNEFRPLELAIDLIAILKRTNPEKFSWDKYYHAPQGQPYFDFLIGDSSYRERIEKGATSKDFVELWEKEAKEFSQLVESFRLYPIKYRKVLWLRNEFTQR